MRIINMKSIINPERDKNILLISVKQGYIIYKNANTQIKTK